MIGIALPALGQVPQGVVEGGRARPVAAGRISQRPQGEQRLWVLPAGETSGLYRRFTDLVLQTRQLGTVQ